MTVFVILLAILLALLTFVLMWYWKQLRYWSDHGIPCDTPHWLYGSFKGINTEFSMYDLCVNYYRKFKGTGPFAGFYMASKPTVFVLDVKLVQQILIKDFSNFTDHGFYHNEEDDPLTPRNCIGLRFALMQTTVGLAILLKNFKFSPCADTEIPIKFDRISFVLNAEKGIVLKVEKV